MGADSILFPLEFAGNNSEYLAVVRDGSVLRTISNTDYEKAKYPDTATKDTHCRITNGNISEIFIHFPTDKKAGTVKAVNPPDFVVDGAPKGLKSGDWIVGESGNDRFALLIGSIEEREHDFTIRFASAQASSQGSVSESLGRILRRLSVALDEDVLAGMTVGDFTSGKAGDLPVSAIQGVGTEYSGALAAKGIATVRSLYETGLKSVGGISVIRMREFRSKAEMVMSVPLTAETEALHDSPVYDLLNGPDGTVSSDGNPDTLDRIYGPFSFTLYPEKYDRNEECLAAGSEIELAAMPAGLKKGRDVLLVCGGRTLVSQVQGIDEKTLMLTIVDAISEKTFVKADTLLYANVVKAGHGERQPDRILGSGDAAQSSQSFVFAVAGTAFVPDALMPAGVRADIDVIVGEQIWTQVATLADSAPSDPHYVVRMTEDGYLRIQFGDGINGRKLPSGRNNVRLRYRLGTGLAGNVPAGGLEKPVNPHPLVDAVRQPCDAAGGADMETAASMRDNAPATLLTLERAVSLDDFAKLASGNSSVWQAKAFRLNDAGSRQERVQVVIVPAGGAASDTLCGSVRDFLQQHALPGVQVSVVNFAKQPVNLNVVARIRSDRFIFGDVIAAVRQALLDGLSLRNRRLGEPLYISEVYKIVEGVTGVESSYCGFGGSEADARVIRPGSDSSVVYLDVGSSSLDLVPQEYRP